MTLTKEQLDFVKWAAQPEGGDHPEPSVGDIIAGCQFEGLGVPDAEDVKAALEDLRQ